MLFYVSMREFTHPLTPSAREGALIGQTPQKIENVYFVIAMT